MLVTVSVYDTGAPDWTWPAELLTLMARSGRAGQFASAPQDETYAWPSGSPRGLDRGACHQREQVEKGAFARRVDLPVDGHELEAVVVVAVSGGAADAFAGVEVTP